MRAHKGRRRGRRDGRLHKGREDSAHSPLALHSLPDPLHPQHCEWDLSNSALCGAPQGSRTPSGPSQTLGKLAQDLDLRGLCSPTRPETHRYTTGMGASMKSRSASLSEQKQGVRAGRAVHGDRRDGDATPGGVESGAAERPVCKATKRAEEKAKSLGMKPCGGPGPGGQPREPGCPAEKTAAGTRSRARVPLR